jgi:hypothetical protein
MKEISDNDRTAPHLTVETVFEELSKVMQSNQSHRDVAYLGADKSDPLPRDPVPK